jgi:hypothetical protein
METIKIISGSALLLVGLFLSSWFTSNSQRPNHDKPLAFHNPTFVIIGTIAWIGFIVCGIILIFLYSVTVGVWTSIILASLWFILRRAGSPEQTTKVLLKTYQIMRSRYPHEQEHDILLKVLKTRHPTWESWQIDSMLTDCNDIRDLISRIIYKETGKWPSLDI